MKAFEKLAHWFWLGMIPVFLAAYVSNAKAGECPTFTHEQEWLLHAAYEMGKPHDWGYTLAAITWQESFLGRRVVRVNPRDGDYGSYGVTHVQATTAVWMAGLEQTPENNAAMADMLRKNDLAAMEFALNYLVLHSDRSYIGTIEKYNGTGERAMIYGQRVYQKVLVLMACHPWQ